MNKLILSSLLITFTLTASYAKDTNSSSTKETNEEKKRVQKQIQEQIEREKKYAKEKTFYQGSDYNLSEAEVNPNSLSKVPKLEPDYDFDMDDAYSDVQ